MGPFNGRSIFSIKQYILKQRLKYFSFWIRWNLWTNHVQLSVFKFKYQQIKKIERVKSRQWFYSERKMKSFWPKRWVTGGTSHFDPGFRVIGEYLSQITWNPGLNFSSTSDSTFTFKMTPFFHSVYSIMSSNGRNTTYCTAEINIICQDVQTSRVGQRYFENATCSKCSGRYRYIH